tara:strand:- start:272 stop:619 length:348 start_codon:yes stop_codon:yes gene_type:complete
MARSRYATRREMVNFNNSYKKYVFKERGITKVKQYNTAEFQYPTGQQLNNLVIEEHIWSMGDKYYKLADSHYGEPQYWWVIALFNQKPAEFLLSPGDVIYIPKPVGHAISYFGMA